MADHDKREVWVRLTPAGRVILRKLALAHRMELEKSGPELASALNSVLRLTRSNEKRRRRVDLPIEAWLSH